MTGTSRSAMKSLRLSASPEVVTCSAETIVPWMTSRSTPAASTAGASCRVCCGEIAHRRGDPRGAHLLDPRGDQVGLDRLGVDLLQHRDRRGAAGGGLADAGVGRRRVVVPGPQALGVEHAQPAGLADRDRGGRADDGVRRAGDQRDLEPEGVDLPGGGDVVGVPGAPGRDDRDLVEVVSPAGEAVEADLDGVACGHQVTGPGSWGLRPSSGCHAGGSRSGPPR